MGNGVKDFQALLGGISDAAADRVVCDNYLNQEELSEEERKQRINEYLSLHCEMEKCLYLTGATMLKCTEGSKGVVFEPTDHNVNFNGEMAIAATDCKVGEHIKCFGVCFGQSNPEVGVVLCNPKIAHNKWLESCSRMKVGDADSVNENSYLICVRAEGGRIYPVLVPKDSSEEAIDEFNVKKPLAELEFSARGKRILMIIEIYGNYSYAKGYLKSDGNNLSKIVGFRGIDSQNVTVGIGDALQGKDVQWYIDALSKAGYDTSNLNSASDFDGFAVPIDICLEKYLIDLEKMQIEMKDNLKDSIEEKNKIKGLTGRELDNKTNTDYQGIELTQNQYDALIITRYQAGNLGKSISDYIINGETDQTKWETEFKKVSKTNGKTLDSRSSFESDLFFGIYDDLSWEYDKLPNEYNFDFSFFENE